MINNPIETIKQRRSVRNYDSSKKVESGKLQELFELADKLSCNSFRIRMIDKDLSDVSLGTYGFISGASHYLVGSLIDKGKESTIAFGKAFETCVLKATELGLGTCWMAGTYNVNDFISSIELKDNESIVIVSPFGYEAPIKRKRDHLISLLSQSHRRRPWDKLFFSDNWKTPLNKELLEDSTIIEMVRIAPSAGNKQPWLIIKQGDCLHLFISRKRSTVFRGLHSGYNDGGIAMAHLEMSALARGHKGEWCIKNVDELQDDSVEYLYSWVPTY